MLSEQSGALAGTLEAFFVLAMFGDPFYCRLVPSDGTSVS